MPDSRFDLEASMINNQERDTQREVQLDTGSNFLHNLIAISRANLAVQLLLIFAMRWHSSIRDAPAEEKSIEYKMRFPHCHFHTAPSSINFTRFFSTSQGLDVLGSFL